MSLNNINSQFAVTRSEIRALLNHVDGNTTVGGQACDALQGMIDALDSIQNDSYNSSESFHRFPVNRDLDRWGDPEARENHAVMASDPDPEFSFNALRSIRTDGEIKQYG